MPDAHEALGKYVQQETPNELVDVQTHLPDPVAAGVVLPVKLHVRVADLAQTMVADGHAVRVTAQIPKDLLGPAEGRLGVDVPVAGIASIEQALEGAWIGEHRHAAFQAQQ